MPNEQKKPDFKWVQPKERTPDIYTNLVHVSWTLFDVRFTLGQLVPQRPGQSKDFAVEMQGAVTVAWPEAKILRDILVNLITSYETTNGEIKQLKIAPAPETPKK